jgi:cytochrome b pre-mRNA-processing protein 6
LPKATPEEEAAQVNALFSLLENRYQKKYPLSPALRRPESNPEHYDKLLEEIERAPGKSWLQVKWEQMKAKVRWE